MTDTATTVTPESGERLIEEGLFRLDGTGTPRLRGSKCPACGVVFFGRRAVCLACHAAQEEHEPGGVCIECHRVRPGVGGLDS